MTKHSLIAFWLSEIAAGQKLAKNSRRWHWQFLQKCHLADFPSAGHVKTCQFCQFGLRPSRVAITEMGIMACDIQAAP